MNCTGRWSTITRLPMRNGSELVHCFVQIGAISRHLNKRWLKTAVLVVFACLVHLSCCRESYTIGYLPNISGRAVSTRQGAVISGAMTCAVKKVNDTPEAYNFTLKFLVNDTTGTVINGTRATIFQWHDNAIAFFGPEDTCESEGTVAAALNLPMISHKCTDSKTSDKERFPTFARTIPTDNRIVHSVLTLLNYYNWKKFSVIVEDLERYRTVLKSLEKQAGARNFTINQVKFFKGGVCFQPGTVCSKKRSLKDIVEETYSKTRVYIFLGEVRQSSNFLLALEMQNLLRTGEYIVIYVDLEAYRESEAYKFIWHETFPDGANRALGDAARSLLVVVQSPPSASKYDKFIEDVRYYNKIEPFFIRDPLEGRGFKKHITTFAAYLYDAVILYADALQQQLNEGGDPRNGTEIIKKIIERKRYKSIMDVEMSIDENGDAEGNYTVLARKPLHNISVSDRPGYKPEYGMYKAGEFIYNEDTKDMEFHTTKISIEFIGGRAPLDEPACGYNGSLCRVSPGNQRNIILGVLTCLWIATSVITAITYRNWKHEQEISGLLWKIDPGDLQFVGNGITSSTSRTSLASQMSYMSRGIGQIKLFTTVALYRGKLVAITELKFSKKTLDLPRDTKKEMKLMRKLHHDNVNPFVGACIQPNFLYLVTEYCAKGSLQDILENEDVKLDNMFLASLVFDLIKGMIFIHESDLKFHGNLKSSNCLVTSRWVLQVADFGLHDLRASAETDSSVNHSYYRRLLWLAPELLRNPSRFPQGTPKGDIYAFGIILHEIMVRIGPFGNTDLDVKEIIDRVKTVPKDGEIPFRPNTDEIECQDYIIQTMQDCWHERPDFRPEFRHIRERLQEMRRGMKSNIMDNMMSLMEKYANNLEDLVDERTALLVEEKKKTEALLHRMLPKSVAEELMRGEAVVPESFDAVTIYFSDIVGFTEMSASSTPMEVVTFLNDLYTVFDDIIRHYDVYKVETIGDAYMVVSGLPIRNGDQHACEIASMALELLDSIKSFKIRHKPEQTLKLRIGIHTGPVVAGVVGLTMPRYCLFGDTVNTASRMESNGEALAIHISPDCRNYLEKLGGYVIKERGLVKLKGKGEVRTYWLLGHIHGPCPRRNPNEYHSPTPFFKSVRDADLRRRSPKLSGSDMPRRGSVSATKQDSTTAVVIPPPEGTSNGTIQGTRSLLRISGNTTDSPQGSVRGKRHLRVQSQDTPKDSSSSLNWTECQIHDHGVSPSAIDDCPASQPFISQESSQFEDAPAPGIPKVPSAVESIDMQYPGRGVNFTKDKNKNGLIGKGSGGSGGDELVRPLLDIVKTDSVQVLPEGRRKPIGLKNPVSFYQSGSKRWRSCDEIPVSKSKNSLKGWFTGFLNNKLVDPDYRRGSHTSVGVCKTIQEADGLESAV